MSNQCERPKTTSELFFGWLSKLTLKNEWFMATFGLAVLIFAFTSALYIATWATSKNSNLGELINYFK